MPEQRTATTRQPQRRTAWWQHARRVYLDNSVFRHPDSVACLGKRVLPELRDMHVVQPEARVTLHASAPEEAMRACAAAGGDEKTTSALLDEFRALPCLEWLHEPGPSGASVEAQITASCVAHRHRGRQVVFTQSRELAVQVRAGAFGGSDRSAKGVSARCVLAGRSLDWDEYDRSVLRDGAFGTKGLHRFGRVVLDTCTLMCPDRKPKRPEEAPRLLGLSWLDTALPVVRAAGGRFVVVQEVFNELDKHTASVVAEERRAASAALEWLGRIEQDGLLERVPGLPEKRHADPPIAVWFIRHAHEADTCVITQDRQLGSELLAHLPGPPRFSRIGKIEDSGQKLVDWRRVFEHERLRQSSPSDAPVGRESVRHPRQPPDVSNAVPQDPIAPPDSAAASEYQGAEGPESLSGSGQAAPDAAPEPARTPEAEVDSGGQAAVQGSRVNPAPPGPGQKAMPPGEPAVSRDPDIPPVPPLMRWHWLAASTAGVLALAVLAWAWPTAQPFYTVRVDGQAVPVSDDIVVLPPGTRFTLQVVPPSAGSVELLAYNASDPALPVVLLRARAETGQAVSSPVLRVQAGQGTDRLVIVHLPDGKPRHAQTLYVKQP